MALVKEVHGASQFGKVFTDGTPVERFGPNTTLCAMISYAVVMATDLRLFGTAVSLIEKTKAVMEPDFHYRLCILHLNLALGQPEEFLSYAEEKFTDEERLTDTFKLAYGGALTMFERTDEARDVLGSIDGAADQEFLYRAGEMVKLADKVDIALGRPKKA